MAFFAVDKLKCTGCKTCVAICPVGILEIDEIQKIPMPVEDAEKRCIVCGHCVAVCPHGAYSLAAMPVEECKELPQNWAIGFEKFATWVKARRSFRTFKQEPVAKEKIERLLDVARYAPSGINLQPVRWLVIQDPAKVRELAGGVISWMRQLVDAKAEIAQMLHFNKMVGTWEQGEDRICRSAPHVLIAAGMKEDITAGQSCTIALAHLELAAHAAGLGACWAGYVHMALLQSDALRKQIGLSHRLNPHGAMLFGYPRFKYQRIPLRNKAAVVWR